MKHEDVSILSTLDVDPHPFFESLREQGDIVWDSRLGGWLVLSYELCRHIEENESQFRHPYADANDFLVEVKGGGRNITVLQGEEHERLRQYIGRMFRPKEVQEYLAGYVKPIIDYLFDRIADKGRADLAAEIADQLPPRVFVALMGMDWMDEALVKRELELHDLVMNWLGGDRSDSAAQAAHEASRELNAILLPQVKKRKDSPGEDIISRLWREAPEVFEDVTEADVLAICRELFLAGSDTTVHAIANAYYLLLSQPELLAAVANDRGRTLDNFIEESLRLLTVVQYRFRIANQDTNLGGVDIKCNDLLIPVNAAGNRDPAKFACPHAVDLKRPQVRSHLAFNAGPRICLGAPLARAELREVINAFVDRLPNVKFDSDAQAPHFANFFTRSFRPLHVTFDVPLA